MFGGIRLPKFVQNKYEMTILIILQASERVFQNLKIAQNSKKGDIFSKFSEISKNVCEAGGVVGYNPLGF